MVARVVGGTMHGALAGRALPYLEQHVRALIVQADIISML